MKFATTKKIEFNSMFLTKVKVQVTLTMFIFIISLVSACSVDDKITAFKNTLFSGNSPAENCLANAPENPYVDEAEDAEKIYAECKEAANLFPDDAEITYLAATSALETNRTEEALTGFQKAEKLGSCKALYFLGDFERHVKKDLETAESYYQAGAECGDKRAAQEVFSPEFFEKSAQPELLKALVDSDMETLNRVRFVNASYVYGFYKELGEQYLGRDFDPCWKANLFGGGENLNKLSAAEKGNAVTIIDGYLYENLLPVAFQIMYPDQGSQALEERRNSLREAGKADLLRLVESSNCNSLVAHRFIKGVETFAMTEKTLFATMKDLKPEIQSITDLPEVLRNGGQTIK